MSTILQKRMTKLIARLTAFRNFGSFPKTSALRTCISQQLRKRYTNMKWIAPLICFLMLPLFAVTQSGTNPWRDITSQQLPVSLRDTPAKDLRTFRSLYADTARLRAFLEDVSMESPPQHSRILTLPLPDGRMAAFRIEVSPVMAPGLAARYPQLRTYRGYSSSPGVYNARLDITAHGFHATISTASGTVYIDPYQSEPSPYFAAYWVRDKLPPEGSTDFQCGREDESQATVDIPVDFREGENGLPLRTYRLALACTGEYAQYHGGTKNKVLSVMVTKVNRLNAVFERELAIRFLLVENNDELIFLEPDLDPYTNGDEGAMLEENSPVLNQKIGFQSYDIGHVLGTHQSFGGIAALGGVCGQRKGAGASAMRKPDVDPFVIDIIAHEIGHQFNARHSFSSCHNVSPETAYEPGGGTTIMSYAGICSDARNNLQFFKDEYFHVVSLEEMLFFSRQRAGDNCAEKQASGNTIPEVRIPLQNGFQIPVSTPFELTAVAKDPDGDSLTYCWEQFDLGPVNSLPGEPVEDSPLFRSLPPTSSPTRVFPALTSILDGAFSSSEVLPTYSRNLTFRCTVRDNHPEAGALSWKEIAFKADSTAGPFQVISGNAPDERWKAGDYKPVYWEVANTDNARVNCRLVRIRLSLDGGKSFPITLLDKTPNDGEAFITVPDTVSNQARLRIEAADNIFFDISDRNFEIWPPAKPGYTLQVNPSMVPQHCLPAPLNIDLEIGSLLGYNESLSLDLAGELPPGASYSFSKNPVNPLDDYRVQLRIDLGNTLQDTFDLQLQAISATSDTALRPLRFITVSNDYRELKTLSPVNGQRGIQLSTTFRWTDAADAETYEFELATNPDFDQNIIESAGALTDTAYLPAVLLEDNQLYFWRIRPFNECGPGPFLPAQALQTANTVCSDFQPSDVPVNISGTGRPTVESSIFIQEDVEIKDVNIPLIRANYQPVRSLKMTLISPAGTQVVLYNRDCGNTVNFRAGFDDEAPQDIACPPDDQIVFRPVDSLARFIGESTFGNWTLRVQVVESGFGASGAIENWGLQFCANFAASDPYLLRNDTLLLPPAVANHLSQDQLEAATDNSNPDKLEFMLLTSPLHGVLLLRDDTLRTGDTYTQRDLNDFQVKYSHQGMSTERDSFYFLVRNEEGGWLHNQIFHIRTDESATTSTSSTVVEQGIQLFPNPLRNTLNVRLRSPTQAPLLVRIHSLQGQILLQQQFPGGTGEWQINTASLPSGMYVVTLQSQGALVSRKIIVER